MGGEPGPEVMVWVVPFPFCWEEEMGGAPGTLVNPEAMDPGPFVLVLTCSSACRAIRKSFSTSAGHDRCIGEVPCLCCKKDEMRVA